MRRSCCDDTRNCRRENTLATITLNIAKANKGAKVKVRSISGLTKLMKMMKITNAINIVALVSKVMALVDNDTRCRSTLFSYSTSSVGIRTSLFSAESSR